MNRYIDADKLKKHIDYCGSVGGIIGEIINTIYDWAKGVIDAEPTADVRENVKGEWINLMGHQVCSICGYKNDIVPTNFCPNCGADMRGEA